MLFGFRKNYRYYYRTEKLRLKVSKTVHLNIIVRQLKVLCLLERFERSSAIAFGKYYSTVVNNRTRTFYVLFNLRLFSIIGRVS